MRCSHPLHGAEEMDENNSMGVKRAAVQSWNKNWELTPPPFDRRYDVYDQMPFASRMNEEWLNVR